MVESSPEADEVDAILASDTYVGNYRVRGLLGEGAMGQVYLAHDVTLGRRVALKLIKRSAMASRGLERFRQEAQTTAQFSHPHIVTLHELGEYQGRPFLALEYLDGESLRARMARGALPVREGLRIMRAVADAVADAHQRGLVHADLKPENIVIPQDGRVRVVDFGLSRLIGAGSPAASGTPAYMAPERWRGDAPAEAIDVWAIGMILHELITGARPIAVRDLTASLYASKPPEPVLARRNEPWVAIVADCLAWQPAGRPSASELVQRFAALLDPTQAGADRTRSPFPGLAAFTRTDADHYFGRGNELDAAAEQLRAHPLVTVVGPSGAGKSSFVQAALIPRLEERAAWLVLTMRPGPAPFERLAALLTGQSEPALATCLRVNPTRLALELAALRARGGVQPLLFVDQLEELFTLAPADAAAFTDCLALAARGEEAWRIITTIREDFFGKLAASTHMRRHLGAVVALTPMVAASLRITIESPLARAGYAFDAPEVVSRIIDDVVGQPACLPLLQFTCRALWDRRDAEQRLLRAADYDAMGGASGALASHAERIMAQLSPEQVAIMRSVLLELIHSDGTRRPRSHRELLELVGAAAGPVIDLLLDHRLLTTSRELDAGETRVDLAHESLATAWPQLARWLDETSEQRLLIGEIDQAAVLWSKRGRREDETWIGAALHEAVRKVNQWSLVLPAQARSFLAAGQARHQRRLYRRRWLVGLSAATLIGVTVVAVLAAIAFSRKEQVAIAQQAEIRLAAADLGRFILELEPDDWDPVAQRASRPRELPVARWHLRGVDPSDPRSPGLRYGADDLRRGAVEVRDGVVYETIEARSGPAFLEIFDRGGACPPSELFVQRLPGYKEREITPRRIHVRFPTCQASASTLVDIQAGRFYRNINLEDGSSPRDEMAWLPHYSIDRTEVTRGAFSVYATLEPLTGDSAAPPDWLGAETDDASPVVGISFFTARAYCRYLGKSLPTIDEWQKAFRGGIELAGGSNPDPLRTTVWQVTTSARPTNLLWQRAGARPMPVGSFPDDTSPYGVLDLAGNVGEWSVSPANQKRLRSVLGGAWDVPPSEHAERITWRNARPDGNVGFDVGVRCVAR